MVDVRLKDDAKETQNQVLAGLRADLAREFHDEIGSKLAKIVQYINLIKYGKPDSDKLKYLDTIEELTQTIIRETKDFIWTIDTNNNNLNRLLNNLEAYGKNLFSELGISFKVQVYLNETVFIEYGMVREVIFIFKEAMTNALKYSQCSNVQLRIRKKGDGYLLSLHDDGCGFEISQVNNPGGLEIMKLRANRINGIFKISSFPNQGTIVSLYFNPIDYALQREAVHLYH